MRMQEKDADGGRWILTDDERILVMSKNRLQRLPFGLLFLLYRSRGQFPKALGVPAIASDIVNLTERTDERYRA
jgi:hypothetical protein